LAGVVAALISGVIVNIALPQIAFEYHLPQPIIQWLSSSYLCASAIGMLLSGRIVSHYGIKTTTIFAMLILTWGSSLGGGGESFNSLIVARIIQGLAAGFVTPVAMTAVSLFIPSNKQGFAFGISGLILVLSPGIGLFLGGQIVEALKWNYVFFAPIPICFISISLAIFYLPSDKEILRNTFHNCFLMLMVFLAGFSVFITSYNGTPLLVLLSASPGVALILGLYFNRSPVQDTGIARKIPGGDFFYSSMAIMFIVG
jgi:MFS family permease